MKTTFALIIKIVVTLIVAWISFLLFNNVILTVVLLIAGVGTILANIMKERNSNLNMSKGKKLNYRTEYAEEIKPYDNIWKPSNRSDDN